MRRTPSTAGVSVAARSGGGACATRGLERGTSERGNHRANRELEPRRGYRRGGREPREYRRRCGARMGAARARRRRRRCVWKPCRVNSGHLGGLTGSHGSWRRGWPPRVAKCGRCRVECCVACRGGWGSAACPEGSRRACHGVWRLGERRGRRRSQRWRELCHEGVRTHTSSEQHSSHRASPDMGAAQPSGTSKVEEVLRRLERRREYRWDWLAAPPP